MHWLKKWMDVRGEDDCPYMLSSSKKTELQDKWEKIHSMIGAVDYLLKL